MTNLTLKALFSSEDLDRASGEPKKNDELLDAYPHDVMRRKLRMQNKYMQIPAYMYIYRARIDGHGQVAVDHFLDFDPATNGGDPATIDHDDVPDRVAEILGGSRPSRLPPSELGENFQLRGNHWDRVSYLAFVIDHENWSFSGSDVSDRLPPAVFRTDKGNGQFGKNHTFFDGKVIPIIVKETGLPDRTRSLFYCVNHLRTKGGGRPKVNGQPNESFKYDLCTKFKFSQSGGHLVLIFDPGGDNQGPPTEPFDP